MLSGTRKKRCALNLFGDFFHFRVGLSWRFRNASSSISPGKGGIVATNGPEAISTNLQGWACLEREYHHITICIVLCWNKKELEHLPGWKSSSTYEIIAWTTPTLTELMEVWEQKSFDKELPACDKKDGGRTDEKRTAVTGE